MTEFLPRDGREAILIGRLDLGQGPTPILVKDGRVWDVSGSAPTVSALLGRLGPAPPLAAIWANSPTSGLALPGKGQGKAPPPRAARPAMHQGRRRHFCGLGRRSGDRGTRPRRLVQSPGHPQHVERARRLRPARRQARLARSGEAQGRADRRRPVVAISRSRHRPRRGDASPRRRSSRPWAGATTSASVRIPTGTIPSRRSSSFATARARRSAPPSATTSICATSSRAAAHCPAPARPSDNGNASCAIGPLHPPVRCRDFTMDDVRSAVLELEIVQARRTIASKGAARWPRSAATRSTCAAKR